MLLQLDAVHSNVSVQVSHLSTVADGKTHDSQSQKCELVVMENIFSSSQEITRVSECQMSKLRLY